MQNKSTNYPEKSTEEIELENTEMVLLESQANW